MNSSLYFSLDVLIKIFCITWFCKKRHIFECVPNSKIIRKKNFQMSITFNPNHLDSNVIVFCKDFEKFLAVDNPNNG
jgi:hypothetical protein